MGHSQYKIALTLILFNVDVELCLDHKHRKTLFQIVPWTKYTEWQTTRNDRTKQTNIHSYSVWIQILTTDCQSKEKEKSPSEIKRCEIILQVMNSWGEYETETKTVEIHTYMHSEDETETVLKSCFCFVFVFLVFFSSPCLRWNCS